MHKRSILWCPSYAHIPNWVHAPSQLPPANTSLDRGSAVLADNGLQGEVAKLLQLTSPPSPKLLLQLETRHPDILDVHHRFLTLIATGLRRIWSFTELNPTPLPLDDTAHSVVTKMVRTQ